MSDLRKAAEQAFEALEHHGGHLPWNEFVEICIDLRAALAKPIVPSDCPDSHQPAAWMYDFLNTDNREDVIRNWVTQDPSDIDREKGFNVRPLYAAPPQRKPLTDKEIADCISGIFAERNYWVKFARAIEQAHGIGGKDEQ